MPIFEFTHLKIQSRFAFYAHAPSPDGTHAACFWSAGYELLCRPGTHVLKHDSYHNDPFLDHDGIRDDHVSVHGNYPLLALTDNLKLPPPGW